MFITSINKCSPQASTNVPKQTRQMFPASSDKCPVSYLTNVPSQLGQMSPPYPINTRLSPQQSSKPHFTFTHPPSSNPYIPPEPFSICHRITVAHGPKKNKNGNDTMSKREKKSKLKELKQHFSLRSKRRKHCQAENFEINSNFSPLTIFRNQAKVIEDKLSDTISISEAKLLLHTLIYHFDGFARQQQLVNRYMSSKYHWGNKRTARVLEKLAEIGVIDRSRSGPDNWTLFFLVRGFLEKCRELIGRAELAIRERLNRCHFAVLSIRCVRSKGIGT